MPLLYFSLLFRYVWQAFGDWKILLKFPVFKIVIKNYFHITLICPRKKLQDLFIFLVGGKLCKERMVTLINKLIWREEAKCVEKAKIVIAVGLRLSLMNVWWLLSIITNIVIYRCNVFGNLKIQILHYITLFGFYFEGIWW